MFPGVSQEVVKQAGERALTKLIRRLMILDADRKASDGFLWYDFTLHVIFHGIHSPTGVRNLMVDEREFFFHWNLADDRGITCALCCTQESGGVFITF
jgi:hypothetical protein